MTSCHHVRAELGGYVLDALEPAEIAAVREHLATCPQCAAEHARLAGLPAMLALADGLEEKPTPPAGIEERLLDAVALERQSHRGAERPRRRRMPFRPRTLALSGAFAAVLVAVVLALTLGGGDGSGHGYRVPLQPVGGSGASAVAVLHSVSSGTTLHLTADNLAGDPTIVYEVECLGGGSAANAGTFRADASGHAYAVLQTALRRGEYDQIRVVRKQRDADGRMWSRDVLEAHLPTS
jgi:predicted anti-sigma-YlaC factor YlaD